MRTSDKAGELQNFGARKIVVGRHFHVAGFAFEHADAVAGPFGKRGVVGKAFEPGCGGAPMRIEDQIESESLRRLHDAQPAAVERFGDHRRGVDRFHGVGDDDARHRGAGRLAGGDGAIDQSAAEKRARRVVNENELRRARRERFEPGAHRRLSRRAARNRRRQFLQAGGRRAIKARHRPD